ncbi:MAG: hypothetical protein Q8O67_15020 [Deltaproteobacteria bacterium]|nr:hypothetical protein [Deltaproteobacteria bacterium]
MRGLVVVVAAIGCQVALAAEVGSAGGSCFPNGTCHKGARCEAGTCIGPAPTPAATASAPAAVTAGAQYLSGEPAGGAAPNVTGKLTYLTSLDANARKVADEGLAKGTLRVCASDVNASARGEKRFAQAVAAAYVAKDSAARAAKMKDAEKLRTDVFRCVKAVKKGADVTFTMALPPGDYEFFSEIPGTSLRGVMGDMESGEIITLVAGKSVAVDIHSTEMQ